MLTSTELLTTLSCMLKAECSTNGHTNIQVKSLSTVNKIYSSWIPLGAIHACSCHEGLNLDSLDCRLYPFYRYRVLLRVSVIKPNSLVACLKQIVLLNWSGHNEHCVEFCVLYSGTNSSVVNGVFCFLFVAPYYVY